jgi:LRR receptor-like serine/threonine-protein kinase FLS2
VFNSLARNLPLDAGLPYPNLESLVSGRNKISGQIPSYLSNCPKLVLLDFFDNLLFGPILKSLRHLKYLQIIRLDINQLTGEPGDQEFSFLSSLSNCRFFKKLSISYNALNITFPSSIGNVFYSLLYIYAFQSQIKGHIPMGIGSLKGLNLLVLGRNNLIGNIPSTIGGLEGL